MATKKGGKKKSAKYVAKKGGKKVSGGPKTSSTGPRARKK